MSRYIRVAWIHEFADEPVVLYSELDEDRFETRKVEVYRDGRHDSASSFGSTGKTGLSETQIPELDFIAVQQEFQPAEISRDEFESVWALAVSGA